ncbi:MAG: PAS domain S-box protein [bacterium]|nr:PAS domain S-box protein [bacterium]
MDQILNSCMTLLKSLPDIVYKIDPEGKFTFVSDSIKMLGYEESEILGKHFSQIIHPEDRDTVQRSIIVPELKQQLPGAHHAPQLFDERRTGKRITKELPVRLESKYQDERNSERKWNVIAVGLYEKDKETMKQSFIGTIGIIRDLSEHKRSEKALIRSIKHYEMLIANLSEVISIIAVDGTVLYKSSSVKRILGYDSYELIGSNEFDFIHENDKFIVHNFFRNNSSSPLEDQLEYSIQDKDGQWRIFRTTVEPVLDDDRSLMCYILNSVDITEQKNAEGKLERAQGELQMRVQGQTEEKRTGELEKANELLKWEISVRKQAEERVSRQRILLNGINKILLETLRSNTEEDIARTYLSVAEELTGSKISFISEEISEEQYSIIALSENAKRECKMQGAELPKMVKDSRAARFWSGVIKDEKSIVVQDLASYEKSQGVPPGHMPIQSFMGIPLKNKEKTFGLTGLANKEEAYSIEDEHDIEILSIAFVEALHRKQEQEKLAKYRDNLEEMVEQRTAELERSREELRSLAAHLETVREEERVSIAREIHDELGQILTVLNMDIVWLHNRLKKDESLSEKIQVMLDLVDAGIESIWKISSELRPHLLDELGLSAALEWYREDFANRHGIECTLSILPADFAADKDCTLSIFRIVQESLTNVSRYSQATRVSIDLEKKAEGIFLKISDNGIGIEPDEICSSTSFGIMGMRERAIYCKGDFNVEGSRGEGTTITVKIPLVNK